jgi:hypothetical protein
MDEKEGSNVIIANHVDINFVVIGRSQIGFKKPTKNIL